VALYKSGDATVVLNNTVNEYVRKYMGIRLSQVDPKPQFVYNTWYPFRTYVNDSLVRDIARAAADCGIQEFIIDDGWQVNDRGKTSDKPWGGNYGDWLVDRKKFPGDLKSTFDYIRSLGMKPGLWISIGSATADSKVFREHPEWFVKNYRNRAGNLHFVADSSDFYTSCFGTGWFDYIKKVILDLVKEHGLAYAKLDLSVVTSAYVEDPRVAGCYDGEHPYHRDRAESFIVIYERVLKLFDELHEEAPSLFIDCTFETEGKLQLQDYAFTMHADGNWLSNFEEDFPVGALRVRQMAWWRTPSMPASSLVIGNQAMDNTNFIFSLKSLIGTLPIVLGDPRKLSPQQRAEIKGWSDWMLQMQKMYDYMSYRQDLPGFGEPREGSWDGWQRINTDTQKGGIFGIFRQGALESSRTVFITGLAPDRTYTVRKAPDNSFVYEATGKSLSEKGLQVAFDQMTDGNVYEVTMKK
jgi:alpha-galactosidase